MSKYDQQESQVVLVDETRDHEPKKTGDDLLAMAESMRSMHDVPIKNLEYDEENEHAIAPPEGGEGDGGEDEIEYLDTDKSFTWRAAILGSFCGALIAISNMYLGLKSGITIGATLFATLLGGVVLKPVLKCSGQVLGIREHCCFQAAGTAAGGLNGGLVAPVLVLFWNGYFSSPLQEAGRLIILIFGAAMFGIVFGVCLRTYLIVSQNLVFPDGSAAAEVLRTMYRKNAKGKENAERVRMMLMCFAASFFLGIFFFFFPVFSSFPIFMYLSNCTGKNLAECREYDMGYPYFYIANNYGWQILFDPVFVASAFMVGPSVNLWFFAGAIVAVGIIIPIQFSNGILGAEPSFNYARDKTLLFPAVVALLVCSITAVLLNVGMFKSMIDSLRPSNIKKMFQKSEPTSAHDPDDEANYDTPAKIWVPALIVGVALAMGGYMGLYHDTIGWSEMIFAIILTFPLAVITAQIQGKTNWGMGATLSKLLMIVIGLMGATANSMLLLGNMVSQAATQTGEVSQCYKTGYLVGASPHAQFLAQSFGTMVGGFASIGAFLLYTTAYPCMLDPNITPCPFPMSAAAAWKAIAEALAKGITIGTEKTDTMNPTGYYLMIICPVIVFVQMCAEKFIIPKRFHKYMPVWTVFFLAFLLPPMYAVAQLLGQGIHSLWKYAAPEHAKNFTYPVAAGLISGGCIATIFNAVFSVVELQPLEWGMA